MRDFGLLDRFFDLLFGLLQAGGALVNGRGDRAFGNDLSKQIADHFAAPLPGQQMVFDHVDEQRFEVRAVLRAGHHAWWKLSAVGCLAARTNLVQAAMLSNVDFERW